MIRKAQPTDLFALQTLFAQYRIFYNKKSAPKEEKLFLKERLENMDSEIFVHEDSTVKLTGFVQLYPLFSSSRMKRYWLLNDLFVAKDSRGKGISVKLIDRAKQLVKDTNACGMYLETEKSNLIGNQLYPKTSFKALDKINFYEWENDALKNKCQTKIFR